jgi:hypothetical protein
MRVTSVLAARLRPGETLTTPVRHKPFLVIDVSEGGLTLLLGKKWKTQIPAECLNGIPNYLEGKDWVEIGSSHGEAKLGTLESYTDRFVHRSAANYVASVLERAGIIEIDNRPPSKARLIGADAG